MSLTVARSASEFIGFHLEISRDNLPSVFQLKAGQSPDSVIILLPNTALQRVSAGMEKACKWMTRLPARFGGPGSSATRSKNACLSSLDQQRGYGRPVRRAKGRSACHLFLTARAEPQVFGREQTLKLTEIDCVIGLPLNSGYPAHPKARILWRIYLACRWREISALSNSILCRS